MIMDDWLFLADSQTTTTSVISTNVVDTQAGGDSYEGAWFVVRANALFTASGSPNVSWELRSSSVEAFSSDIVTLCACVTVGALTEGQFVKVRIGPGAKRYIAGYKDVTNYSSGSIEYDTCDYDMFIVKDTEIPKEAPNNLA